MGPPWKVATSSNFAAAGRAAAAAAAAAAAGRPRAQIGPAEAVEEGAQWLRELGAGPNLDELHGHLAGHLAAAPREAVGRPALLETPRDATHHDLGAVRVRVVRAACAGEHTPGGSRAAPGGYRLGRVHDRPDRWRPDHVTHPRQPCAPLPTAEGMKGYVHAPELLESECWWE